MSVILKITSCRKFTGEGPCHCMSSNNYSSWCSLYLKFYTNLLHQLLALKAKTDLVRSGAITSWRVTYLLWDWLIIKFIRETGALQRGSHRASYRDNIVFLFKQNTTCTYRIYEVFTRHAFHMVIIWRSPKNVLLLALDLTCTM